MAWGIWMVPSRDDGNILQRGIIIQLSRYAQRSACWSPLSLHMPKTLSQGSQSHIKRCDCIQNLMHQPRPFSNHPAGILVSFFFLGGQTLDVRTLVLWSLAVGVSTPISIIRIRLCEASKKESRPLFFLFFFPSFFPSFFCSFVGVCQHS